MFFGVCMTKKYSSNVEAWGFVATKLIIFVYVNSPYSPLPSSSSVLQAKGYPTVVSSFLGSSCRPICYYCLNYCDILLKCTYACQHCQYPQLQMVHILFVMNTNKTCSNFQDGYGLKMLRIYCNIKYFIVKSPGL